MNAMTLSVAEEAGNAISADNNRVCSNGGGCYDLKLKVSSNKTTLVLSNTRELDRVPSTK